ncbi:PIN domain-containing protein [Aurantimonas aggregata]|uniref:Ribonuclease VapC n=1 Tax=Aurantimonas aggregata TaxID=2047720 RepID=A0A6L9MI21_9HYPH|nr:PIN domain-containing protein [Aurantimonas aggregata]NDV87120.1 PIN domain-containing protein [Aurantimonas aggregata]
MTRFLLDTNIISDVFRNPGGRVDNALRERQNAGIGTSLIVVGEILYGLKKNQNMRGLQRFEVFMRSISVWALEPPVATIYGEVRNACERMGKSVGPNDLWIAAHAVALDATLVTDDRAFEHISALTVENWLRA